MKRVSKVAEDSKALPIDGETLEEEEVINRGSTPNKAKPIFDPKGGERLNSVVKIVLLTLVIGLVTVTALHKGSLRNVLGERIHLLEQKAEAELASLAEQTTEAKNELGMCSKATRSAKKRIQLYYDISQKIEELAKKVDDDDLLGDDSSDAGLVEDEKPSSHRRASGQRHKKRHSDIRDVE